MRSATPTPVVHLELHTRDLEAARAFYASLCGWRAERIETQAGAYHALALGSGGGAGGLGGGMVECSTERALWLPYVEVPEIVAATERARAEGARVMLEPREGPAGFRSVVATPAGGEVALWQQKR